MDHDSIMSFGKHKGEKLRNVPASYLLWWYDQQSDCSSELSVYISKHRDNLEKSAEEEKREYWKNKR